MPRERRASVRFSKTSTKTASAVSTAPAGIRQHGCCSSRSGVRQQIAASGEAVRTQGLIPAARHDVAWVKAPEQARAPGRASRRAHGWTLMQTSKEQHARPFGCKVLLDDLVSTRKER